MSIETLRPTANVDPYTTGWDAWPNPANAYDGNTSTTATGFDGVGDTGPGSEAAESDVSFNTWQAPAHQSAYTALTLNVLYSATVVKTLLGGATGSAAWSISYSTDGGTTWTTLAGSGVSASLTTATVSLSVGVTFSNIQVRAEIITSAGGSTTSANWNVNISLPIHEVWTEGTYPTPPPPPVGGQALLIGF